MATLLFPLSEKITGKIEAGLADAKNAEDFAPLFGAGIQAAAYEADGLRFNVFAAGRYVSGIEYKDKGFIVEDFFTITEFPDVTREEDYYELGGGFTLSKTINTSDKTQITPYGGLVVALIRGSGEETFEYFVVEPGVEKDSSVDFEEDGPISIVAGVAVKFPSNVGLRLEGRFIDQSSITAGAFFAF